MVLPEGGLNQAAQKAMDVLAGPYQQLLFGAAAFATALSVAAFRADAASDPFPAEADAATLHSPHYLKQHCPIAVSVNFDAHRGTNSANGVSIESQATHVTVNGKPNQFAVRYKWQLSKKDRFGGIVGGWFGPKFRSLKPTTEGAHSGTYIDTSVEDPSNSLAQFTVYAARRAHADSC